MFKPKFSYTNNIVNNLTFIAESKAIILNAPLIPKWEINLRKEAILNSAHASTAIEGNSLNIEDVSALANGREIMARRKDKQEVLNYLNALKKIPYFSTNPLELEDLLEIHKILTNDTLESPEDVGVLRNKQVYIGRSDGSVVFMPPATEEVPNLINNFLDWFNSDEVLNINPIIVAGLTHYELVRIHPFIDGNGRTARVIATLVLYKFGFDLKRFFTLDDYYDMDRQSYYHALGNVNQETLDLTQWLEYFIEGVAVSINKVKEKVISLSKDAKILKEKGQIALNERQMQIVEKMIANGKITNKKIQKMFSISNTSAKKEINKLLELNVIKMKGKGRNIHYVLN